MIIAPTLATDLTTGATEQFARRFTPAPSGARQVMTAEDAVDQLLRELTGLDREHCLVVGLDTRNRVLGRALVSIGNVGHTFMTPREVFRDAIAMGATAILLAHNHPSGDPTPSTNDIAITADLAATGDVVNIPLLDHLVVGTPDDWTSMADLGHLPPRRR